MTEHHLAQLNIATPRFPMDDPRMAGFTEMLDPINALADASPGFVWRLRSEGANDATAERPFGPDLLVNFSVWESVETLWNFTYRSDHLSLLRERREWFQHTTEFYTVMWWVPAGRIPTLDEAGERLAHLRAHGPTAEAFTFRNTFPPPARDTTAP
ncbi:hypothetical protein F4561_005028 [Lipingzhangella halophila]|uniref:DUF3291 domain-containing protein n=1 Tax=Lipingzhangella halophila TaxID=1783352 RepID=A0A7W7RMB4_9ACTN|nr:DUF3291 domain-containing protein [Lipingzhangella halophila]MBB4934208.1 hypothetical protein [Lipingzhangella halophila]